MFAQQRAGVAGSHRCDLKGVCDVGHVEFKRWWELRQSNAPLASCPRRRQRTIGRKEMGGEPKIRPPLFENRLLPYFFFLAAAFFLGAAFFAGAAFFFAAIIGTPPFCPQWRNEKIGGRFLLKSC
jgi:hypothetical protein